MESSVILFGGTFDPPHVGHLAMATLALEQTGADCVWFLPAPDPPHKPVEVQAEYGTRVRMVEALLASANLGAPRYAVSTLEAELPRPSYTLDSILHCKAKYPQVSFRFLMGSDSLAHLPMWYRASELVEQIDFLVAPRSDYPYEATLAQARLALPDIRAQALAMPMLDVSSTWLRERWRRGRPLCGLVPEVVTRLIPSQPR